MLWRLKTPLIRLAAKLSHFGANTMRLQIAAVLVAVLAAAVIVGWTILLGFGFPFHTWGRWGLFAIVAGVAASAYMGVAMSHEIFQVREFLKQLAVWLGIVSLVPLVVWY